MSNFAVSDAKVEDACSSSSSSTGCKGKQRLVLLAPQISVSSSATMSDGTDEGSEDEDGSSSASGPSSGSSTPNNQRFNNNPFVRARSGAASKATVRLRPFLLKMHTILCIVRFMNDTLSANIYIIGQH